MPHEPSAFRRLHVPGRPFAMPNPWDVGSAKLFAAAGFSALATSSAGFAWALGKRDGATTWEERMDHCRALVAATPLPVSADLENGLGHDPESAAETVRQAAAAGLAGCSIEDFTGDPAAPFYEAALAVERIAAAAEAARRLGRDFVLTARADGLLRGVGDVEAALRRLEAFAAAGADVLYAPLLPDLAAVRAACALGRPFNFLAAGRFRPTMAELAEAGVARVSLGSGPARVAYGAALTALREIAGSGRFDGLAGSVSTKEIEAALAP